MNIPIIDSKDENFKKKLAFNLWSTHSSSDYRNDRKRPYNGQEHTDEGKRGKTKIKGLTMRDISDCIVQGFLAASGDINLQDKTVEIDEEFKNTQYANKNSWRYQDIYKIDLSQIDPGAVIQNTLCFIEFMMGIYPNVPELTKEKIDDLLNDE